MTNTPANRPQRPRRTTRPTPKTSGFMTFLKWFLGICTAGVLSAVCLCFFIFYYTYSQIPTEMVTEITSLKEYRPRVPLRIWSAEGQLIGTFGEERREFVPIEEVPQNVKNAILAAEDAGFYSHPGFEVTGIIRAAVSNLISGRRGQGGSTITQQVARNFFLSSERTYTRKLWEIAMAYKIENTLSKDKILEIYLNQIYLGQRAHGFQSAAYTYFGRPLEELTIAEIATIAGLPVAPSAYNPIVNPTRATMRKNYVLRRMYDLGFIDEATFETEKARPMETRRTLTESEQLKSGMKEDANQVSAKYAAELARMLIYDIYKNETYSRGLNVYTTIRVKDQQAAVSAVRQRLIAYDRKYGYRGPEDFVELGSTPEDRAKNIKSTLSRTASSPFMLAAIVTEVSPQGITVAISPDETVKLDAASLKFGARYLGKVQPKFAEKALRPGSLVRIMPQGKGWTLAQVPLVEAAFASCDFNTGAVRALVGGFDFNLNKFNHVTQAWRQPGSSFKPFIYSAALDKGFTPSTIINDAPISISIPNQPVWEPKNYEGRFDGPMTLRRGLEKSKNLISIRILQAITPQYAQEFIQRFGFQPKNHPAVLPMALGAGSVTPWQMLGGYTVFANGGYRVQPYLIERVTDTDGRTLMRTTGRSAGDPSIRALDDRNAYTMHSLMHGVATHGTAASATRELKRKDIAGKTGTTNNAHDAWFCGYAGNLVAVAWMGYDTPKPLGSRETGGGLALPVWIDYMRTALKNVPDYPRIQPQSIVEHGGEIYYRNPVHGTFELDNSSSADNETSDLIRDQIF